VGAFDTSCSRGNMSVFGAVSSGVLTICKRIAQLRAITETHNIRIPVQELDCCEITWDTTRERVA
jgi:hypothetical protein